ncbi:MAG: glycosyltransferase family 39 protein [Bacteroidetes bacterium]|nr:glycosyltransferase family 39 protein [Bacteroidota bacterium]
MQSIKTLKINFLLILKLLIIANVLFLIVYETHIKDFILLVIKNNPDPSDRDYYSSIFQYLEYPIVTTTIILVLLLKFRVIIITKINNLQNTKNLLSVVLVLVFVIQVVLVLLIKNIPFSDSAYYVDLAERLYQTGSYTSENGFKSAFWPIGLPAYLALARFISEDNLLLVKFFNILFYLTLIVVTYKLFSEQLSKKALVVFLICFSFFPNNLFSANVILTDYPFSLLVWICIFITIRYPLRKAVIVGILLALSSYLRPVGLLLPFLIILYYFKSYGIKSSLKYSGIILAVFILILSPWIIRNYQVFNSFVPVSTNGGLNFLMGNHPNSNGNVNFNFEYDVSNPNEVEESVKAYSKGFKSIFDNPLEAIVRSFKKIFFAYIRGDSSITWSLKQTENKLSPIFLSYVFFFTNYFFYVIIFLSFFSFYSVFRKDNSKFKSILNYVYIFFISMILIYVGSERYLIPILPIHFLLFSVFMDKAGVDEVKMNKSNH